MLIGMNFPSETSNQDKITQLSEMTSKMSGKVRIYESSNLDNYVDAVKRYDPRVADQHLVLLNTHYNYSESLRPHDWRMHEFYFDFKGGIQWGVPVDRAAITYQEDSDDYAKMIATASWTQGRSALVRSLSGKYLGSTTSEPHTLLIGYGIEYAASSYPFKCLLGSLPDNKSLESGNQEWWSGVALLRLKDYTTKVREHFIFSNIVTLGDTSHEALTEYGIDHGAVPKVPYEAYHGKIKRYSPKYGTAIREAAATKRDMRDWTE